MENAGITSQYGFEFQKLVFIYYALKLSPGISITYEGNDDVELINDDGEISSLHFSNSFIQVKSGKVLKRTLERVICNWLLMLNDSLDINFKCITEISVDVQYKDDNFIDNVIETIKNAEGRNDSLFIKIKKKYTEDENYLKLKADLRSVIQKTEITSFTKDEFIQKAKKLFIENYCTDVISEVIYNERFVSLCDTLCDKIRDSIIKKESYRLSYGDFFSMASEIKNTISENRYEKSFDKFKEKSKSKIKKIFDLNSDSIKQLKLVYPNKEENIMQGLAEQIFYEDLRFHFIQLNREAEIFSLEFLAHSNYEDVLSDFENSEEKKTPYKVYRETTKQELQSALLPDSKFYNRGCYIHLTDTDIDEDLKIKWGDYDEE